MCVIKFDKKASQRKLRRRLWEGKGFSNDRGADHFDVIERFQDYKNRESAILQGGSEADMTDNEAVFGRNVWNNCANWWQSVSKKHQYALSLFISAFLWGGSLFLAVHFIKHITR